MPFKRRNTTFIVIPATAGPGEARIVITSVLPEPLNSYTFTDRAGYTNSYAGAIIFYSSDSIPPLDNTYTYLAVVENAGAFSALHMGEVHDGSVREVTAGVPAVQIWSTEGSSVGTQKWLSAGFAVLEAYATTGEAVLRGRNGAKVRITNDAASGEIIINATGSGADLTITVTDILAMTAGSVDINATTAVTIDTTATNSSIALTAGGSGADMTLTATDQMRLAATDINLDATTQIEVQGTRAHLLTQQQTNLCTAALSPIPNAYTDITGCLITFSTVTTNARYKVDVSANLGMNPAGLTVVNVRLLVDGVAQTQQITAHMHEVQRDNEAQHYSGSLASAGSHTFKIQARDQLTSAVCDVAADDTTITVTIEESGG